MNTEVKNSENKKNAKLSGKILNTIFIVLVALTLILTAYVLINQARGKVPTFFGYSVLKIATGSMESELPVGTYILTKRTDAKNLDIGDIITFYSRDASILGKANTHRISAINRENDEYIFTTKGDANASEDKPRVLPEDIIGKFERKLDGFSKLFEFFSNKTFFILLIFLPCLYLLISSIITIVKKSKEIKKESLIEAEIERLKKEDKRKNESSDHTEITVKENLISEECEDVHETQIKEEDKET